MAPDHDPDVVSDVGFTVVQSIRGAAPVSLTINGGRVGDHAVYPSESFYFEPSKEYLVYFIDDAHIYLSAPVVNGSAFVAGSWVPFADAITITQAGGTQ